MCKHTRVGGTMQVPAVGAAVWCSYAGPIGNTCTVCKRLILNKDIKS